jgi:hypothetical protein
MDDGATSFLPIACTEFEYFLRCCVGHACLTIHSGAAYRSHLPNCFPSHGVNRRPWLSLRSIMLISSLPICRDRSPSVRTCSASRSSSRCPSRSPAPGSLAGKSGDLRNFGLRSQRDTSQTSCPTEENGLPARKHNFFSVPHNENEAPVFLEAWLFHVAQIDNREPAGAKENELSNLRSHSLSARFMRSLPSGRWTRVKFRQASRREISSIRTMQIWISSVRRTQSSR